jgi:hypothetical protein
MPPTVGTPGFGVAKTMLVFGFEERCGDDFACAEAEGEVPTTVFFGSEGSVLFKDAEGALVGHPRSPVQLECLRFLKLG